MAEKTVRPEDVIIVTDDPDLLKYDDYNLAKIAKFIGQDSLDQVLEPYKSQQKFTIGDVLKRLGIKPNELDVDPTAILRRA